MSSNYNPYQGIASSGYGQEPRQYQSAMVPSGTNLYPDPFGRPASSPQPLSYSPSANPSGPGFVGPGTPGQGKPLLGGLGGLGSAQGRFAQLGGLGALPDFGSLFPTRITPMPGSPPPAIPSYLSPFMGSNTIGQGLSPRPLTGPPSTPSGPLDMSKYLSALFAGLGRPRQPIRPLPLPPNYGSLLAMLSRSRPQPF